MSGKTESMPSVIFLAESRRMGQSAIARNNLCLTDLTVYTEAATGAYGVTTCLAAAAGAHVIALARDSKWGSAAQAAEFVLSMAKAWGVAQRIQIVFEKKPEDLASADIITNSGHVRPLDAATIAHLKETAVIPMLWETFEWRPEELDLKSCKERGILVMGTDEQKMDFFPFAAEVIIKFLHLAGITVHHSTFLCLGSGPILEHTCHYLRGFAPTLHIAAWNQQDESIESIPQEKLHDSAFLASLDAVICDERHDKRPLLGADGLVDPHMLAKANPACVIINRHGIVRSKQIAASGLRCLPTVESAGWQTPNMTTAVLGLRPVLELMSAGLKVGQAMAKARLSGMDPKESALFALNNSYAQDLCDPYSWLY